MIRYNKVTNDNITKVVRNYNAKITRLSRSNPYLSLPEKASVRNIKKEASNRQDLKRILNSLKRFSKRGAENNVILPSGEMISAYELSELRRESARVQRNLTRRINKLAGIKPKVAGVIQDYTYAEMGDMRLNNMIAKRDTLKAKTKNLTKGNIKEFARYLEKTRNKQNYQINLFKNNYLDKMLFAEGYMIGYDMDKINTIKEKLGTLSNKDFLKVFDEEKLFQMIRDLYPKNGDNSYYAFEDQLTMVYDELYNNIDDIVATYSSA